MAGVPCEQDGAGVVVPASLSPGLQLLQSQDWPLGPALDASLEGKRGSQTRVLRSRG